VGGGGPRSGRLLLILQRIRIRNYCSRALRVLHENTWKWVRDKTGHVGNEWGKEGKRKEQDIIIHEFRASRPLSPPSFCCRPRKESDLKIYIFTSHTHHVFSITSATNVTFLMMPPGRRPVCPVCALVAVCAVCALPCAPPPPSSFFTRM
jgi:hypothetical protein